MLLFHSVPGYHCTKWSDFTFFQRGYIGRRNNKVEKIEKKRKKEKTLWPLFMDGIQLPQGYSHFEEAVYFLPFIFQKFLVLILLTSEGWKAELTLELPSGFEHRTPEFKEKCYIFKCLSVLVDCKALCCRLSNFNLGRRLLNRPILQILDGTKLCPKK